MRLSLVVAVEAACLVAAIAHAVFLSREGVTGTSAAVVAAVLLAPVLIGVLRALAFVAWAVRASIAVSTVVRRLGSGAQELVTVLPGRRPAAFTYGLRRPRICVTQGTLDLLSKDELAAVLAHEDCHVRRHEPSRRFAVGLLRALTLLQPLGDRLWAAYLARSETEADAEAVALTGRPALARALLLMEGGPVGLAPAFASSDEVLRTRLAGLSGNPVPGPSVLPQWPELLLILGALSALCLAPSLLQVGPDSVHHAIEAACTVTWLVAGLLTVASTLGGRRRSTRHPAAC